MFRFKKAYWQTCFSVTTLLLISFELCGQMEYGGKPMGPDYDRSAGVHYIRLQDAVKPEGPKTKRPDQGMVYKVDEFASVETAHFTLENAGNWTGIDKGTSLWRIGLTARNASSLGVTFSPFKLNPGVKVFVYTPDGKMMTGAFSFRNNKPTGVLPVSSLAGDSIIIEIQSIRGIEDVGDFAISSVSVGYPMDPDRQGYKDGYYDWSADCQVDINCIGDNDIQLQKFSVCRLIIEDQTIRRRCTGTLLNNTSGDGTPYVITARHCVSNEMAASHTLFYFDYESPYCEGPDGEIKSLSGAYIRSTGQFLDFVLLEISEKPPVDYTPVYSGWNANADIPHNTYSIHHPEGDVKKFSRDDDAATLSSFGAFLPNTFWQVEGYEEGSTENGSSGAALFNAENQVVGTLTGGGAVCSDPILDCYQQFAEAWLESDQPEAQLRHWLDPLNTGTRSLKNLDPYLGLTLTLSNILDTAQLELLKMDKGWGYVSGHNSIRSQEFAEHFHRGGSNYIYALNMKVGKAYVANSIAEGKSDRFKAGDAKPFLKVKIWNGKSHPENLIYEKDIFPFELDAGSDNFIRLDSLVLVNEHYFVGYEVFYESVIDTFALYTGVSDTSQTEITALMNTGEGWSKLHTGMHEVSLSLAISPAILYYYPKPGVGNDEYPFDPVTVYPNPTYDHLQILFEDHPIGDVRISVYDLFGNFVFQKTYPSPEPNIQLQTGKLLVSGMYFIKIEHNGQITVKKFLRF